MKPDNVAAGTASPFPRGAVPLEHAANQNTTSTHAAPRTACTPNMIPPTATCSTVPSVEPAWAQRPGGADRRSDSQAGPPWRSLDIPIIKSREATVDTRVMRARSRRASTAAALILLAAAAGCAGSSGGTVTKSRTARTLITRAPVATAPTNAPPAPSAAVANAREQLSSADQVLGQADAANQSTDPNASNEGSAP